MANGIQFIVSNVVVYKKIFGAVQITRSYSPIHFVSLIKNHRQL